MEHCAAASQRANLAEQAREDLATELVVVRRERDTVVQSCASLLRAAELRDQEIAGLHAKIQKLLEEHSVVLEERIAESRENGSSSCWARRSRRSRSRLVCGGACSTWSWSWPPRSVRVFNEKATKPPGVVRRHSTVFGRELVTGSI